MVRGCLRSESEFCLGYLITEHYLKLLGEIELYVK
jgi:hypothetical protein